MIRARLQALELTLLTLFAMTVMVDNLAAQPGEDGGSWRRGPGPTGRGPGGGGPGSFLARLDTNHNGMLDPDEMAGRMRRMLEHIARRGNLDLSRPVPLDAIGRAFAEMRNQRLREGGDDNRGPQRDRRGEDDDDERGRDGARGRPSRSESDNEPLVPGFGEVDLFDPVPGFGRLGERFAVTINEEDRRDARRAMSRYDANKDGVLDPEELRRGRWREDTLLTDRNGDGKLTSDELALRYAIRRVERETDSDSGRGSSSRSASSSSPNSSSDRRSRGIASFFGRYDRDGNGTLEGEEMGRLRGGGDRYDANHDGKITRDEFAEAIRGGSGGGDRNTRSRFPSRGGNGGVPPKDADATPDSGGSRRQRERRSYRRALPFEQLAEIEGLPAWFSRYDADKDGQVQMWEYATTWTEELVSDFAQFDLNGDGIVTPNECLAAADRGAVRGDARSPGASSNRFGSNRPPNATAGTSSGHAAALTSSTGETTATAASEDISARYVKFAVGVIRKYDTNKDGVLTAEEWKDMGRDYSSGDTDADGRLTPAELATALAAQR